MNAEIVSLKDRLAATTNNLNDAKAAGALNARRLLTITSKEERTGSEKN